MFHYIATFVFCCHTFNSVCKKMKESSTGHLRHFGSDVMYYCIHTPPINIPIKSNKAPLCFFLSVLMVISGSNNEKDCFTVIVAIVLLPLFPQELTGAIFL